MFLSVVTFGFGLLSVISFFKQRRTLIGTAKKVVTADY